MSSTINVDNIKGADGGPVTSIDVAKIDTPGDLTIDVDGGTISIQDGGTEVGKIDTVVANGDLIFETPVSNGNIIFKGNDDGTSGITAAAFDMSRDGDLCMGATSSALSSQSDQHAILSPSGFVSATSPTGVSGFFGRNNDGILVLFYNNGTSQGSVSVSGGTVSFNQFLGSHPSRLSDNSKPTILKGTILETIDEMMDWYQLEFKMSSDATITKIPYLKPMDKNVNDTVSYTHTDGNTYTATIKQKGDEKHVKCKISDTADSTRVYGVFQSFDEEDIKSADGVNDINISAVGTYPVRIHKDQTVSAGDLLVSNGDGTAKKQSDDIIRSKTIGKVLTNIKTVTHSDGSYLVPCALYCG